MPQIGFFIYFLIEEDSSIWRGTGGGLSLEEVAMALTIVEFIKSLFRMSLHQHFLQQLQLHKKKKKRDKTQ